MTDKNSIEDRLGGALLDVNAYAQIPVTADDDTIRRKPLALREAVRQLRAERLMAREMVKDLMRITMRFVSQGLEMGPRERAAACDVALATCREARMLLLSMTAEKCPYCNAPMEMSDHEAQIGATVRCVNGGHMWKRKTAPKEIL